MNEKPAKLPEETAAGIGWLTGAAITAFTLTWIVVLGFWAWFLAIPNDVQGWDGLFLVFAWYLSIPLGVIAAALAIVGWFSMRHDMQYEAGARTCLVLMLLSLATPFAVGFATFAIAALKRGA